MILLEDEKNVLKWISEYGPLTRIQLLGLLSYKTSHTAEKIIRNVRKSRQIQLLESGYYALDRFSKPDIHMNTAVWVLLCFIDKVQPSNHRSADYPAQIFFVKESQAYEIVVIPDGEEYITQLLRPRNHQKYILVISDIGRASMIHDPAAPFLFAVVMQQDDGPPEVAFYSREELSHG